MEQKQIRIFYIVFVVLGLMSMLSTCNSCNARREIVNLKSDMDSLRTETSSKKDIERIGTEFQIEGYRISKRMLYDNNTIVRSTIRPDDRMNEYDKEIEKIQKK